MKIILNPGSDIRLGYTHFSNNKQPNTTHCELWSLPIPDESVTEINAQSTIDCMPFDKLLICLHHWFKKLSSGGILYLQSKDIQLLGNLMAYNNASVPDINRIFYDSGHKSAYSLNFIENSLKNIGFKIANKGYIEIQFYITAVKP